MLTAKERDAETGLDFFGRKPVGNDMTPKLLPTVLRLCVLLAIVIMVSVDAQAQSVAAPPALFRIVLTHAVVCVSDRRLEVEAELRNTSGRHILLSPAGLLAQVSFTNRASSIEDGFRSKNSSRDPLPGWKNGRVVTLAPGESYRQVLKLELEPDFFSPGVYRVQISYSGRYGGTKKDGVFLGTIDSNEALFEVDDCQPAKDSS